MQYDAKVSRSTFLARNIVLGRINQRIWMCYFYDVNLYHPEVDVTAMTLLFIFSSRRHTLEVEFDHQRKTENAK